MDDAKRWSVSANDAVTIILKHPTNPSFDAHFHPAFTYPIFGDKEVIFGYEGLGVKLSFTANTLEPSVDVTFGAEFQAVGDTKPDDIKGKLAPFLPSTLKETATLNESEADNRDAAVYDKDLSTHHASEGGSSFVPPGKLVHEYNVDGRKFGIWSASLTEPRAKRMLRHAQILVPMFIEGGMCIELDDPEWTIDRWRVFFIFAMDDVPDGSTAYSFAGYSTAYRLFYLDIDHPSYYSLTADDASSDTIATTPFPPNTDKTLQSKMPSRQRISQFLILPPYQSTGHGSHLYNTMLRKFLAQSQVKEITVEDPNESFDVLRDTNDLLRLRRDATWTKQRIDSDARLPSSKKQEVPTAAILDPTTQSAIRHSARLAPRQLSRLSEMQLLSEIPPRNRTVARITRKDRSSDPLDRAYFFWRLLVKQRLYKFNREALGQLEAEERVDRLEDTIAGVEREYEGVLERADRRSGTQSNAIGKKRKLAVKSRVVPERAMEPEEAEPVRQAPSPLKKRVRIEDEDDE